jgi:WD40 repeat protein
LSGSDDGHFFVGDAATGRAISCFEGCGGAVTSVGWSPDARRVLAGTRCGHGHIYDGSTGRELCRLENTNVFLRGGNAWSPDGQHLALPLEFPDGGGAVSIVERRSGREQRRLAGYKRFSASLFSASPQWSPDGKRLLSVARDPFVVIWDAHGPDREILYPGGNERMILAASWSPDGRHILTLDDCNQVCVFSVAGGSAARLLHCFKQGCDDIFHTHVASWSPDGTRILLGCQNNSATIRDIRSGEETVLFSFEEAWRHPHPMAWSPDGRTVLACDNPRRRVRILDSGTGREVLCFDMGSLSGAEHAAWSPDGRRILVVTEAVHVFNSADGGKLFTFRHLESAGHQACARHAAWSPDGKRLLAGFIDGTSLVYAAESGKELYSLGQPARAVSWSPDGALLAGLAGDLICLWESGAGREVYRLLPCRDGLLTQYADGRYACHGVARVGLMREGAHILPMETGYEARWRIRD